MNDPVCFVATAGFEAARRLGNQPDPRQGRLHGHSFQAQVRAVLPPDWASFPGAEADTLSQHLHEAVAPLDYALLNDLMAEPTDEQVARWVQARLRVPGVIQVRVHSAADHGVALHAQGAIYSWRRFRFEAAHQLPHVPVGHPCGRLHGHGFEVVLWVSGTDTHAIAQQWQPLYQQLHLSCLNDHPGLDNPTSERLAAWLWQRLHPVLPALARVTVYETATAGCHYQPGRYRIWKERVFESALRLTSAPASDPRRRLHGHSYRLRLHLTAPLDAALGWTVDYGEVKARFGPLYQQLDHHRLDEIAGLPNPTLAELLHWIRVRLTPALPVLNRIDIEHSPGGGASLSWSLSP